MHLADIMAQGGPAAAGAGGLLLATDVDVGKLAQVVSRRLRKTHATQVWPRPDHTRLLCLCVHSCTGTRVLEYHN
jgi:hypothetical protein